MKLSTRVVVTYGWLQSAGLAGTALMMAAPVTWAEETKNQLGEEIHRISDLGQPTTTVNEWLNQIAQASLTRITGIQLNTTDTETDAVEIELVLEAVDEQFPEPSTSIVGNALIAEIPNAILELPEGNEFQQANPTELPIASKLCSERIKF